MKTQNIFILIVSILVWLFVVGGFIYFDIACKTNGILAFFGGMIGVIFAVLTYTGWRI